MDPQKPFFKRIPMIFLVAGLSFLVAVGLWPSLSSNSGGSMNRERFRPLDLLHEGFVHDWIEVYGQAWIRVQAKVDELRHTQDDNAKLRLENAHLRLGLESLQLDCHASSAAQSTRAYEERLTRETGARVGRVLAGITYKPPTKLLPSQLYMMGVSYLKAQEDEKAAVIFTILTGLEETDVFKTPSNLLVAGVAWYRIENFVQADFYFDEVLKKPEKPENLQAQAQARLWKALVAKRLKKDLKTQYWLNDLVDHHPHSAEAAWVNYGKK